MDRTPVSSSNLASIGYDPSTKTLGIEFNDGALYQYDDVPESEYTGLMGASSHGKYFHRNIKSRYRYRRIN